MTWTEARHEGHLALEAKDQRRYRAALQALYDLSGDVWLLHDLAAVDVVLGDRPRAISEVGMLASEGLGVDLEADPELSALKSDAGWPALVERMRGNRAPVAGARRFAQLPSDDLVAEDIAYDAATQTFFVSSVRKRKIVAVDARTGAARDFVPSRAHGIGGVAGLALRGATLFATTADFPLVEGHDPATPLPTGVLAFDARSGALLDRVDLPADGAEHGLTDMTATDDAVFVSDAAGGAVYRLTRGAHVLERLTRPDELSSPQTPAISEDGRTLFIADYARGIAALDLQTRTLTWLARGDDVAMTGIDGLYATTDGFLAVQNGMAPPRLARFFFSADGQRKIARADVLERATPGLREPTHGVLVGGSFYFIAASGWDRFDEHGAPKPDAPPDAPAIWVVPMK